MNNIEKILTLYKKHGRTVAIKQKVSFLKFFSITKVTGYLNLYEYSSWFNVMYTSNDTYHSRDKGPVLAADFATPDGKRYKTLGFQGAYKSVINLHPVGDEKEAIEIFNKMVSLLDLALKG